MKGNDMISDGNVLHTNRLPVKNPAVKKYQLSRIERNEHFTPKASPAAARQGQRRWQLTVGKWHLLTIQKKKKVTCSLKKQTSTTGSLL